MNILKAQQEILKALVEHPENVRYFRYSDDEVFLSANGKVGYIIPPEQLRLTIEGAQLMFSLEEDIKNTYRPFNRMIGTDEYRMGGDARKYVKESDRELYCYVDQTLLKCFTAPTLYWGHNATGVQFLVVAEESVVRDDMKVVGIVMPVKIKED